MYDDGRGVPHSDTEAAKWYRKAADQGNAKAQLNMGILHSFIVFDSISMLRCAGL